MSLKAKKMTLIHIRLRTNTLTKKIGSGMIFGCVAQILFYLETLRLLSMSEIEREGILAQRQEDLQKLKDKRNLDQMFKAQRGGDPDAVSKAAKRMISSGAYIELTYRYFGKVLIHNGVRQRRRLVNWTS